MKYTDYKKVPVIKLELGDMFGSEQNGKISHLNYREVDSISGKVLSEGKCKTVSTLKLEDIDVDEKGFATNVRLDKNGIWLFPITGTTVSTEGFGKKL